MRSRINIKIYDESVAAPNCSIVTERGFKPASASSIDRRFIESSVPVSHVLLDRRQNLTFDAKRYSNFDRSYRALRK